MKVFCLNFWFVHSHFLNFLTAYTPLYIWRQILEFTNYQMMHIFLSTIYSMLWLNQMWEGGHFPVFFEFLKKEGSGGGAGSWSKQLCQSQSILNILPAAAGTTAGALFTNSIGLHQPVGNKHKQVQVNKQRNTKTNIETNTKQTNTKQAYKQTNKETKKDTRKQTQKQTQNKQTNTKQTNKHKANKHKTDKTQKKQANKQKQQIDKLILVFYSWFFKSRNGYSHVI